jgi:hypothetical protein
LCPNIKGFSNFTISGLFTDYWYQYLEIKIKIKNEFINLYEEIRKELLKNPLRIDLYLIDTGIDYDNIDYP